MVQYSRFSPPQHMQEVTFGSAALTPRRLAYGGAAQLACVSIGGDTIRVWYVKKGETDPTATPDGAMSLQVRAYTELLLDPDYDLWGVKEGNKKVTLEIWYYGTSDPTPAPVVLGVSDLEHTSVTINVEPPPSDHNQSAVPDPSGYEYRLGSGAAKAVTLADNSFDLTGLTAETEYTIRVRTINDSFAQYSPWSQGYSFTTLETPVSTPTGLSLDDTTALQLTATWDATTGADSYDLQWRTGTDEWTLITGADNTGEVISGLMAATMYEVQVRAVNTRGPSNWSASVSATTPA